MRIADVRGQGEGAELTYVKLNQGGWDWRRCTALHCTALLPQPAEPTRILRRVAPFVA